MYTFSLQYDNQRLQVQNDPIGWDEGTYTIKRSKKDGDGTFKTFNIDLVWIKDGADFIKSIYELEGIEALIVVKIYLFNENRVNELILTGKLNLTKYEVDLSRGRLEVSAPIENEVFINKIISLKKKKVDLSSNKDVSGFAITPIEVVTTNLHSKSIAEEYSANLLAHVVVKKTAVESIPNNFNIIQHTAILEFWSPFVFQNTLKSTMADHFSLGETTTDSLDSVPNFFTFVFDTVGTLRANISQELNLSFSATNDNGHVVCSTKGNLLNHLEFEVYFEWRDKDNVTKQKTLLGQQSQTDLCGKGIKVGLLDTYEDNISKVQIEIIDGDFKQGDKLYLYSRVFHLASYKTRLSAFTVNQDYQLTTIKDDSFITIDGVSVFEDTQTDGVMIYEAFDQVIKHISGLTGRFKSDYLGRTDLGYAQDGVGALRLLAKGKNIRGFNFEDEFETDLSGFLQGQLNVIFTAGSPIFASFDELIKGFSDIDTLSYGFEVENGQTIVRVEPIEYFYDSDISLTLERVTGLKKSVIADKFITTFNIGYQNWTGQKDIGTLLEINSDRQYYTGLTQIDKEENKLSEIVTGSYAIESTRRLSATSTTKDGQYDDKIFCISVLRNDDPIGTNYISESNENVLASDNIEDIEGVYNLRLSPARNMIRWGKVLAASFYKNRTVEGIIRFAAGKGNYRVSSKLAGEQEVSEFGDFNVNQFQNIWINEAYEFEHPLTLDQLRTIQQKQKNVIKFTDNSGVAFYGYVMEVEVNIITPGKSKSTFKLLRAR